jgi:protein-S-isoprenylcysteine O-methyltransferase Ste14
MVAVKLVIFAIVSTGIVWLSWPSLHDRHSHGFFRTFAFECILALVLLNVDHWFHDPYSTPQIVSWALLLASLFLAVQGFYLLRRIGRPRGKIEDTTTLVTVGAYRTIRHPLYSSLLLGGWGAFFKDPSLPGFALALATTAFLIATARVEEKENIDRFGSDYADYMETTWMFIPFLL